MDCTMVPPAASPAEVKETISTTCSVSNMSISSDVDSDVASICRDFIRGVCARKKRCKFMHPTAAELSTMVPCREDKKYEFCHDHQNKTCERNTCRYIHCSSEEEQNFLKSKHLPLRYKCQYELGIYNVSLNMKSMRDGKRENENKRLRPLPTYSHSPNDVNSNHKRSSNSVATTFSDQHLSYGYQQILDESKLIRKENDLLKQRIEELHKKVNALSSVNEMLLDQNASYRHVLNLRTSQAPPTLPQMETVKQLSPYLPSMSDQNHMYQTQVAGGPIYTPSMGPPGVIRVVNQNPVMTPSILNTQPTASNGQIQPVLSSNPHQVSRIVAMPPPGLQGGVQAVPVAQNQHIEVQLSQSQPSGNDAMVNKRSYQPVTNLAQAQFRPGSSSQVIQVNPVPVVTMHASLISQIRPVMDPSQPQAPTVQVSSAQDMQPQMVTTYAGQRQPQNIISNGQPPHMTGQPTITMQQTACPPIQYQEMASLPVHHQHP